MLNQQTIPTRNAMRLFGMAKSFEERAASPRHDELSNAEFVGLLVEDEKTHRENQRLKRLLKSARLRFSSACMEDIDYQQPRGLTKQMLRDLTTTQWIQANRNVIPPGPTGGGPPGTADGAEEAVMSARPCARRGVSSPSGGSARSAAT